ncbi:hypothetical protein LTR85_006265 [Meristemomyces frigidus]|nr:hypothetical protein LTR85_006265 [Meristemomyces frigidus]
MTPDFDVAVTIQAAKTAAKVSGDEQGASDVEELIHSGWDGERPLIPLNLPVFCSDLELYLYGGDARKSYADAFNEGSQVRG